MPTSSRPRGQPPLPNENGALARGHNFEQLVKFSNELITSMKQPNPDSVNSQANMVSKAPSPRS
jgi:hypothetical protein